MHQNQDAWKVFRVESYGETGCFIAKAPAILSQIEDLRREAYEVFSCLSVASGGPEIKDDFGIINFRTTNQPKQFQAVKQLWNSPALFAIGGNPIFKQILKEIGLMQPILELQPLLRCDIPIKEQSIFEQHQDYPYNIGSLNSVTIWIPLQDVDIESGALLVAPGTHLNGVYPNRKGIIVKEHRFRFESVPMKLGEVLVFNQKLVHQSGMNVSDKIRFSVQLRFSDLACKDYASRGYPINHKVTTESYAGEIA